MSLVFVDWGVKLYVHGTSNKSSTYFSLVTPSLFLSSKRMTLLAISTYSFVYGCSTKLIT